MIPNVSLHRAREARRIEQLPFFSKDLNALSPYERRIINIWSTIIDERAKMLPERIDGLKGPQSRWGKLKVAV